MSFMYIAKPFMVKTQAKRGQINTQEPTSSPFHLVGTIVEARCYLGVKGESQDIIRELSVLDYASIRWA